MNLALVFDFISALPELIGDVETAVAKVKADTTLQAKATDALAALESIGTTIIPALKSL